VPGNPNLRGLRGAGWEDFAVPPRNTPAAPLAAIYVRVSSKEQVEGYSLDAQRRACRDLCASRGYQVVADYADEGISAHTDNLAKRPGFSRMLAAAGAARFSVILARKMARCARNLRGPLAYLERLGPPR